MWHPSLKMDGIILNCVIVITVNIFPSSNVIKGLKVDFEVNTFLRHFPEIVM